MIVKNNAKRLIVIDEFKLLPGCNDVDTKEWNKLKDSYNLDVVLETSDLEIIKTKKGEKDLVEFKDFDAKKKKEILSTTYSLKTLEEWLSVEEDVSLKYEMEKRIDGIKNKTITNVKEFDKPKNHI